MVDEISKKDDLQDVIFDECLIAYKNKISEAISEEQKRFFEDPSEASKSTKKYQGIRNLVSDDLVFKIVFNQMIKNLSQYQNITSQYSLEKSKQNCVGDLTEQSVVNDALDKSKQRFIESGRNSNNEDVQLSSLATSWDKNSLIKKNVNADTVVSNEGDIDFTITDSTEKATRQVNGKKRKMMYLMMLIYYQNKACTKCCA